MTPIEALVQIVQSAERNPVATVGTLAAVARVALRESGEHGMLSWDESPGSYRVTCYCGREFYSPTLGIEPASTISAHALAMKAAQ